jgi:hypothetical protein
MAHRIKNHLYRNLQRLGAWVWFQVGFDPPDVT